MSRNLLFFTGLKESRTSFKRSAHVTLFTMRMAHTHPLDIEVYNATLGAYDTVPRPGI